MTNKKDKLPKEELPELLEKEDKSSIIPHNPLEGNRPELSINLHDGSEEQIAIIIVHKDTPEYLNILLQSIAVTSFNNNYEIIVVDNGSGKDSQDFLDDIETEVNSGVKLVRNENNLFWSEACNKGAAAADPNAKYFVFLHSDVVITNPSWLDVLLNVSESQTSGMVGIDSGQYMIQGNKVSFVQEWLVLFTRECFEKIGPWPLELPQIAHSFIMTMRAQSAGYKPQIINNPMAHHYQIFSLDVSEHERMTEKAMSVLPALLRVSGSRDV